MNGRHDISEGETEPMEIGGIYPLVGDIQLLLDLVVSAFAKLYNVFCQL